MLLEWLHYSFKIGGGLNYHGSVTVPKTSTTPSRDDNRRKLGKEFGPLVSTFVFLPLLAILAVVQLPLLPIAALWERSREKRLLREMTKQSRVMAWHDFVRSIKDKHGTWIIGGLPPNPDWWWAEEDVRSGSPYPCPDDVAWTDERLTSFRLWCYERYTNRSNGRALLVVGRNGAKLDFLEKNTPEVNSIVAVPPTRSMRKRQQNLSG